MTWEERCWQSGRARPKQAGDRGNVACVQQLRLTRSCAPSEWRQCSERVSDTPLPDQPIIRMARNTIVPIPSSQTAPRAGPLWSEQRKGLTRIEAQPLSLGGVSAHDTRSGLQPRSDAARLLCPRLPSSILILLSIDILCLVSFCY